MRLLSRSSFDGWTTTDDEVAVFTIFFLDDEDRKGDGGFIVVTIVAIGFALYSTSLTTWMDPSRLGTFFGRGLRLACETLTSHKSNRAKFPDNR